MRQPFYRKQCKAWYVKNAQGKFIRLSASKSEAFAKWKAMLVTGGVHANYGIVELFNAFLVSQQSIATKQKFDEYSLLLQRFIDYAGDVKCSKLDSSLVHEWLESEKWRGKPWSLSRKRDAGSLVRRAMQWAEDKDLIRKSPINDLRLKTPRPRSFVVPDEFHRQLVEECKKSTKSRSFCLYLIASRCGARPAQIRDVTCKHVSMVGQSLVWVFSEHKTRHKTQKQLTVYLSPCLQTLTRILMHQRGDGHLFLNDNGGPWLKDTVSQRLRRLRDTLKLPDGMIAYAYRHTFATNALLAGIDIPTVAALLGHSSSAMVSKVYGHLDQHREHLINATAKASSKQIVYSSISSGSSAKSPTTASTIANSLSDITSDS